MNRTTFAWVLAVALLLLPLLAPELNAAPKRAGHESGSRVIMEWEEFKKITGMEPGGGNKIVLLWKEVQELLGIELRGINDAKVTISWQEFKKLIKWSMERKNGGQPDAPKPPTPFVVTKANYTGTAGKDGIVLKLEMTVDVLQKKGWKRIPILPANVAIQDVKLPEGCFLDSRSGIYTVLTEKSGTLKFAVEFAVSVRESQGVFGGSFGRMPSGASTLTLKLAEKDAKVTVRGAQTTTTKPDGTVVAALPSSGSVGISWRRAIEKVKGKAKVYAESQTLVQVGEGVIVSRQNVSFSILHNKVDSFSLRLPKGVNVLSVVGMNIRDWRTQKGSLTIELNFPHLGNWNAQITTEKAIGKDKVVDAPILRSTGVEREKGYVVVVAMSNVEITTAGIKGASAIDVREVPHTLGGMTRRPILLSYRYIADDFSIKLGIKKHDDVAVLLAAVDSASAMVIQTVDGIRVTNLLMNVRNSRKQNLRLTMPKGSEIWSAFVAGERVTPGRDKDGTMLIPLVSSGSGSGHTAFPVEITYMIKGPALAKKGEAKIRFDFPQLAVPITHFMCTLYMPADYEVPKRKRYYSGPLRFVTGFTALSAGPGAPMLNAEESAKKLSQLQQQQAQRVARQHGGQTIRVQLPVHGKPIRLEKILVIDERVWTEFEYEYDD